MSGEHIKDTVRGKYGEAALRVLSGERASCCGDAISSNLYDPAETATLPERAVLASLGCGDPTALAERSEEHTSELQSRLHLVCRLLLEKKKKKSTQRSAHRRTTSK